MEEISCIGALLGFRSGGGVRRLRCIEIATWALGRVRPFLRLLELLKDSCKENIEFFVVLDSFNIVTFFAFDSLEDIIGLQVGVNIERKLGSLNEGAHIEAGILSS